VAEEAVQKWGGYLSYRTHFLWRKITFLWSDSKNWGGLEPPLPPLYLRPCNESKTQRQFYYEHAQDM